MTTTRRPRTRGDLPSPGRRSPLSIRSSPHARGSSRPQAAASSSSAVVPARAGIFRFSADLNRCGSSRPRTRGDLPRHTSRNFSISRSSPHARGSSESFARHEVHAVVVPARAGIFPSTTNGCRRRAGRPRTRGDLPRRATACPSRRPSSPHARGSSHGRAESMERSRVVPARAGIFPRSPTGLTPSLRRPRTRGDLPRSAVMPTAGSASSPHARGSSAECVAGEFPHLVVPARAGIFPSRGCSGSWHPRRPRTRGDLPAEAQAAYRGLKSSPHARGSSPRCDMFPNPPNVVPARAGIFPAHPGDGGGVMSRPRTRGDLPTTARCQYCNTQSSPHARGSSLTARTDISRGDVVPARAGIFRTKVLILSP